MSNIHVYTHLVGGHWRTKNSWSPKVSHIWDMCKKNWKIPSLLDNMSICKDMHGRVSGPGDRCVTFASCLPRPDGDAHVAVCSPSATALSMKFLWGAGYSWTVSKTWTGKEKCFCFTTIIRTIPVHFLDKFSQVAQQTQQQGRRSINALRLCLTSAKNGGQCQ